MQAETGSELLSHLSVCIDCHVTGHYKHPSPSPGCTFGLLWQQHTSAHTSSSPWMAGHSQGHGIPTCGMWVKNIISTLAANFLSTLPESAGHQPPLCHSWGTCTSPRRRAAYQEAREGETGEKCPSQQKHTVAGGERKLHYQVSPKSCSR